MAEVLVLGAGLNGFSTAMLLARDGHQVTALERDAAEAPEARQAWETWERRGVSQFRLPHVMLPRWRELMERELPEVLDEVLDAGGLRPNLLAMLPEPRRGALRDEDPTERMIGIRAGFLWATFATKRIFYVDRGMSPGMILARDDAKERGQTIEYRTLDRKPLMIDLFRRKAS